MVLARYTMNEKSNLSQFSKRFSNEFDVLLSMLTKLKLNARSHPTMTIEEYVTKLIAAFYIEALPKSFDDVRKDISNDNMTSVSQPSTLIEAIKLADQYDNIKASSMLAAPASHNNKSPTDNLAGAITNPKKPANPNGNKKQDKKKTRVAYTDPNKPPPTPWDNMAYCKHCKSWGRHTIDKCRFKIAEADKKDNNKGKQPQKPGKVGAATTSTYNDDANTVWG
jgi:hypothetical protein